MEADLKARQELSINKADRHSVHSNFYHILHYCIGYPQVILSAVIAALTANKPGLDLIFAFSLLNTILSLTLVFFKVTQLAQLHHASKGQWDELAMDIRTGLLLEDLKTLEQVTLEKEKFIKNYEPNFCGSQCIRLWSEKPRS